MSVKYFDTSAFLAHYDFNRRRIEISELVKQFPELHEFVLKHEKDHARIFEEKGFSFRHIAIDFRDRFKLYWNRTLFEQLMKFMKLREPKKMWHYCFMIFYNVAGIFTLFLKLIAIRHILSDSKKFLKSLQRSLLE